MYVGLRSRPSPPLLNRHKVSTLALFKSIMDHKQYLPREQPYKDLVNLIQFLLRQFFKAVEDDSFIIIHVNALSPVVHVGFTLLINRDPGSVPQEPWSLETVLELET